MSQTIYLDNSTLETVAKCDTATILGAVNELGPREESPSLVAGSVLHAALALHLQGEPKHVAMGEFERGYYDIGIQQAAKDRLHFDNVYRILDLWLDANPLTSWPLAPLVESVEQPLSEPLLRENGTDVVFVGLLDALVRDKRDGQLAVLDHKSTGAIHDSWKSSFQLKSQIDGYLWLAQHHYPQDHIHSAYINAIEVAKIPDSNRKCTLHGVRYAECGTLHLRHELFSVKRTQEQIDSWHITAIRLARKYLQLANRLGDLSWVDTLDQQGRFNGSCQYCSFQLFCAQSRPVDRLDSLFIHRPWRSLLEQKVQAHAVKTGSTC